MIQPTLAAPTQLPEPTPTPQVAATHLVIPVLGLETDLVEAPISGGTWDVSKFHDEVAHLESTAYPGLPGNAVLAGHVRTARGLGRFRNLVDMQPGDLIIVQAGPISYVYQVMWVRVLEPTDVEVVMPTTETVITLLSCTNWDNRTWTYRNRVAVRAELVEVITE
jgi:LPXTG-site transpeptidase (sortase) family protein